MAHSEETKQKIRDAWKKRRETFVPPMKDKKMSEEARRKMSEAAKNRPSNRLGKGHSLETRAKISATTRERTPRGPECHSYKDGKYPERRKQRFSMEYKRWRFDVFMRDRFTCQHCGDNRGRNLHAHHIKPFATHPELRFEISNGITLCETCHAKEHQATTG